MTRRSAMTRMSTRRLAASRMTVGTREWSEQPVLTQPNRWWQAFETPIPDVPVPTYLSHRHALTDIGGGPTTTLFMDLGAGEQTILILGVAKSQELNIDPGWQVLLEGIAFNRFRWACVMRNSLVNERVNICSTDSEKHAFNQLSASGFSVKGPIEYTFKVAKKLEGNTNQVTLHSWEGFDTSLRFRALYAYAVYASHWEGQPYDGSSPNGHNGLSLGYISPETGWWNAGPTFLPNGPSDPEAYLTADWLAGSFNFDTWAYLGAPVWIEFHVKLDAA